MYTYILSDGITSYAYEHYKIQELESDDDNDDDDDNNWIPQNALILW